MDRDRMRNDWNDRSVDTYDIFIEPGVDAREVQRRIADEFGTRYDLHVVTKAEFERLIIGTAKAAFYLTYAIVAVCVFIGLLHLSVAFLALARDRRHELNVLRAMGAPTPHVVASFSLEASAVCLAGSILGAVAGVGLAWFGTTRFSDQVQGFVVTPHFDLSFILAVALLFVAVGVMASRRASRLQCEAADLLELSSDPS
jgi:ABC-type antimicrobial peptide transport system permease subunit